MTILKLFISCALVAVGMVMLPPLTGSGMGSIVARIWLGFGLLVFYSHYLQYSHELEQQESRRKLATLTMLRPRSSELREYSSARR